MNKCEDSSAGAKRRVMSEQFGVTVDVLNKARRRKLEAISEESGIPVDFLDGACERNEVASRLDSWLAANFESFVACAPPNSEYIVGVAERSEDSKRVLSFGVHYARTGDDATKIRDKYESSIIQSIHPRTTFPG